MRVRASLLLLAFVNGLAAISGSAVAVERYALVVGVKDYPGVTNQGVELKLNNPVNDAFAIAQVLRDKLGFKVTTLLSSMPDNALPSGPISPANLVGIHSAWLELLGKLRQGDVALFYFAGHGVELKGRNYLLPQDAVYKVNADGNDTTLQKTSLDFQTALIDELGLAQKDRSKDGTIGIFIIDACRENPLRIEKNHKANTDVPIGLRAPAPPAEMFVMYSAGVQQKALDGEPGGHSMFAEKLIEALDSDERRGLPLSLVAQSLRMDVFKYAWKKKGKPQTPAYYDQFVLSRSIGGDTRQVPLPKNEFADLAAMRALSGAELLVECTYCPEVVTLAHPSRPFAFGKVTEEAAGSRPNAALGKRIAMGRFEVTNREWNACVRAKDLKVNCKGDERTVPGLPQAQSDRYPVTDVSFDDALDFVAWVSEVTKKTYRLPTEGEWEYAALGGMDKPYGFDPGDASPLEVLCEYANGADKALGILASVNHACSDGIGRKVAPIESFKPNNFGLHDMLGNVWEWTSDCWYPSHDGHPKGADGMIDASKPREAADGNCTARVVKGGSWRSGPDALRPAARNTFPVGHGRATLGFRVVREITENETGTAP